MAQDSLDLNSLKENLPSICSVKSKPEPQPQLELTVLSWNINGPGLAKHRNRLVPAVVKKVNPDVLLLQETKTDKLILMINEENSYKYKSVEARKKDESRVLYDSSI